MTEVEKLAALITLSATRCANTFCNTCPWEDKGDDCCEYFIAEAILNAGYKKED